MTNPKWIPIAEAELVEGDWYWLQCKFNGIVMCYQVYQLATMNVDREAGDNVGFQLTFMDHRGKGYAFAHIIAIAPAHRPKDE